MPDLKEISQHLDYLRLQGRSDWTIRDRRHILSRLARALPVPLIDATPGHLLAWRAGLTTSAADVVNQASHVRQFYVWAATIAQLRPDNPVDHLPVPRLGRRLPRPISEAALMDVLAAAPRRIRPWIVLAGWCGLRCQEIAWLRAEDVHLDAPAPYILVTRETAKGIHERVVHLCDFAVAELAACNLPRRGWCWTRRDGQPGPNKPARVSELICKLLHDCGYPDTAHSLRHHCLTRVQQISGDVRITQEVAGHTDLSSTMVYTHVSGERTYAVMQQLPVPGGLRMAS